MQVSKTELVVLHVLEAVMAAQALVVQDLVSMSTPVRVADAIIAGVGLLALILRASLPVTSKAP